MQEGCAGSSLRLRATLALVAVKRVAATEAARHDFKLNIVYEELDGQCLQTNERKDGRG